MTLLTVLALVAVGMLLWVYRLGKQTNELGHIKSTVRKIAKINLFNRKEDEETDRQVNNGPNAGGNPISGPWLRK
jgi:hypothetical protein